MHDNPRATEEEQEQVLDRVEEEENMQGYEHGDPELPGSDDEDAA